MSAAWVLPKLKRMPTSAMGSAVTGPYSASQHCPVVGEETTGQVAGRVNNGQRRAYVVQKLAIAELKTRSSHCGYATSSTCITHPHCGLPHASARPPQMCRCMGPQNWLVGAPRTGTLLVSISLTLWRNMCTVRVCSDSCTRLMTGSQVWSPLEQLPGWLSLWVCSGRAARAGLALGTTDKLTCRAHVDMQWLNEAGRRCCCIAYIIISTVLAVCSRAAEKLPHNSYEIFVMTMQSRMLQRRSLGRVSGHSELESGRRQTDWRAEKGKEGKKDV